MKQELNQTDARGNELTPVLAADAYNIKRTTFNNAISCKFDNRRVTVIKHDNGYSFEFRAIDHNYTPHAHCECIKGKLALTAINLSKEASEIIMFSLAEHMGFRICR